METLDIDLARLGWLYGLCLLPWSLLAFLGVGLTRDIVIGVLRMTLQLGLVGIYLKTLFTLNDPWLNTLWIVVMLIVADLGILKRAGLGARYFALSTFIALTLAILLSTAYLVVLVIQPAAFYDARYLIPLAGMILGNCMQSNVIALERFFARLRHGQQEYMTFLLLGASRWEAVRPYFREAIKAALNPCIANMATMGLVSLPGMMTGQILGGSEPWVAVKYQLAIMICIFTSTTLGILLNLSLSLKIAFDEFDVLKEAVMARREPK